MSRQSLSVDSLVNRMAKSSRTSGWDAVVSYRLDVFRALLQKGLDNSTMEKRRYNLDGVKTYEMQGHSKKLAFELDWKTIISPPTRLDFTADGQVILKMPMTAVTLLRFMKGRSRYYNAYRRLNAGWVLTITSPISSLSASQYGYGLPKKTNGTIFDFTRTDETYLNKMIFDLELRDNWSVSIDWEGATELEAKKRVPKPLLDSLKWSMRNDLGGIWFSLPLANNGDSSIKPEYIAFQIYAVSTDAASQACVSAYIKTDVTSLDLIPGDLKPNFSYTDDGQEYNLYPLPSGGYSASIILHRRMLFGDPAPCRQSIWQPLKDVQNESGTRAFTSVGDDLKDEPRDSGFQLKLTWNGKYPAEDADKYMKDHDKGFDDGQGDLQYGPDYINVVDVENAVNASPLPTVTVSADGTVTFDSNLNLPITIQAGVIAKSGINPIDRVVEETWKYTAKVSKKGKFELDGLTLQGTLGVNSGDWTKSWEKIDNSCTAAYTEQFMGRLTWPTWDRKPKRNLTALTNFLNPAMEDVLTLKRDGVRVPYDFLLLGDVTRVT